MSPASAQQRPGLSPRRHPPDGRQGSRGRDRSTKAGALTPATLGEGIRRHAPGHRSTKAGALTPATLPRGPGARHPGQRSTKAGALTPATRQQARGLVPHAIRSTKAGALTPATPAPGSPWPCWPCSLNKGRGSHPGDTRWSRASAAGPGGTLNKGRGSHPGDTGLASSNTRGRLDAQQRPGLSPRRHVRPDPLPPRWG